MTPSRPVSGLTAKVSSGTAMNAKAIPNASATLGSMRPAGSGRLRVRAMRQSISRSRYMLRVFAAPTIIAVPNSNGSHTSSATTPGASDAPPAVVSSAKVMMRGFMRASRSDAAGARVMVSVWLIRLQIHLPRCHRKIRFLLAVLVRCHRLPATS